MSRTSGHVPDAGCPRCGATFHCGANDASQPCACTHLRLDATLLARLRGAYVGCLCLRCLAELASGTPLDATDAAGGPRAARTIGP
jgi:hypothetical protein